MPVDSRCGGGEVAQGGGETVAQGRGGASANRALRSRSTASDRACCTGGHLVGQVAAPLLPRRRASRLHPEVGRGQGLQGVVVDRVADLAPLHVLRGNQLQQQRALAFVGLAAPLTGADGVGDVGRHGEDLHQRTVGAEDGLVPGGERDSGVHHLPVKTSPASARL